MVELLLLFYLEELADGAGADDFVEFDSADCYKVVTFPHP